MKSPASCWPTGTNGEDSNDRLPLTGVRVIDLTHARAGPTTVRHLADWGADVVRVDQPVNINATEDIVGMERGSDYQNLHRNKRSIRLDLKKPEGRSIFYDLVKRADVVVENMRPMVKQRLEISYDVLSKINPRLVYGSISGFGQTGPYRDRPGVDQIAQGMVGLMSVTGEPNGTPLRVGVAIGDLTAGNLLALNIMMALFDRERTGSGRWVHTSLIESLLFMMDFQAARWLVDHEVPKRVGNEHPTAIPTSVFETTDGHITLCAGSGRMWTRLCEVLSRPDWAERKEWMSRDGRRKSREEIHDGIAKIICANSTAYWIKTLNAAGVTCGPIYSMDQVFEDEQVQHLEMIAPVTHPDLGKLNLVASPLNFSGVARRIRSSTPDGGSNTEQILRELGYPTETIASLRASQIC